MRRAQDRARSARSRKNGAQNATIESLALGALKLASEASCARCECASETGRFFIKRLGNKCATLMFDGRQNFFAL